MAYREQTHPQFIWPQVEETLTNLTKLHLLCSDKKALKKEGYVVEQMTPTALLTKLRCQNCKGKMKPPNFTVPNSEANEAKHSASAVRHGPLRGILKRDLCEFHPGRVIDLHFTCCKSHVAIQKGCQMNPTHVAPENYEQFLAIDWAYHQTPSSSTASIETEPIATGRRRGRARFTNLTIDSVRSAIALDCEFGLSIMNEMELIRITAIDFFTKQVLIDSLVKPQVPIKNYMTRYSGVTSSSMRNAIRTGSCLFGRDAARDRLFTFVNQDTVVVLHGGSSDMSSMRWIHPKILDTHILETYFAALPGGRSLKNLCEKKFSLQIQNGAGHDSHEDALACRQLAIWMMDIIPDA